MGAHKVAVAAILGLVAALILSVAPPAMAAHGDASGLYGGALRVSVRGSLSLNPFTATDADSWKVIPLVYDSLARIDPVSLMPAPWAAQSWSISGSTLSVTLRSDLEFHDGSALSAADVVYSYNRYKDPAVGMAPADLAVSGTGTSVTLSSASAGGLLYGSGLTLPIVKSGTAASPVGSGPWRLQSSTASSWTLAANKDHFWAPYLETVTFSVYANTTTAATALLSGNLDFIGWTLGVDEPSAILNISGADRSLLNDATIVRNPGLQHLAFGFNMDPSKPTSDDGLRSALAKTLHPILYTQIYDGTVPSRSPIIQEDLPWYNPNVPVYQVLVYLAGGRSTAYLTEGLQLLDAAGYIDRNADGIREDTDGSPLSLTAIGVPVTEDTRQFTVGFSTVDIWARLGLNVNLETVPSAQMEARLATGNFDVFVTRLDSEIDPGFMRDYLHTAGDRNWVAYSNSTLDGYLVAADAALDPAARKTEVDAAQLLAMQEAFLIPVIHFNAVESTVRGAFDGWVNMPGGVNNFWTYQMVHVVSAGSLQADLTIVPNSVLSGGTTTAIARVVDAEGAPVDGATVTFWIGGAQVESGVTDPTGTLRQDIDAPTVGGATDVEVVVQASKLGYAGSSASAMMTVKPDVRSLAVAVASSAVTIASGAQATITVTVTSGGAAVAGAQISLQVIGLGGGLTVTRGTTNAQGQLTSVFKADVGPRTQFRIVAEASAAGYADGSGSTTVVVEQRVGTVEPRISAGLDIGTIAVAISALAVIAALAAMMARRK